jgi:hypothetical protein
MWLKFFGPILDTFKLALSRTVDVFMWLPRTPIPQFRTPLEAWRYLEKNYEYTGDWWDGKFDFNIDPEKFQTALAKGKEYAKKLPIDCDDVALWAFRALLQIPGCNPQLKAIYDPLPSPGAHAICTYALNGGYGVIDTNGHHFLPDLSDQTICAKFTELFAPNGKGWRYDTVNNIHRAF